MFTSDRSLSVLFDPCRSILFSLPAPALVWSYLGAAHANRFLKRTFFHPSATKCEEQKREAREDYGEWRVWHFGRRIPTVLLSCCSVEERCEPSFPLFRNTGKRRFCPDIHDWKEFDNYEIGDGFGTHAPAGVSERKQHNAFDQYRRPTTSASYRNRNDEDDSASDD